MKVTAEAEVSKVDFFRSMFELSFEHLMWFGRFGQDSDKDITDYITAIESYNDFDFRNVARALKEIDSLIPRKSYGGDNPNNGQKAYEVGVGRESSPVIYIRIYEFDYGQKIIKDVDVAKIKDLMVSIGKADEVDSEVVEHGQEMRELKIRFWWD